MQRIFAYVYYPLSFPVAGSIVCLPLKSTLSLFDCPRTMFCIHSGAPLYILLRVSGGSGYFQKEIRTYNARQIAEYTR